MAPSGLKSEKLFGPRLALRLNVLGSPKYLRLRADTTAIKAS